MEMTLNHFKIEDKKLHIEKIEGDHLIIHSIPENYEVFFKPFDHRFTDDMVILIDKNVRDLYNINHTKLIEIEATEEKKSIETVLEIASKLVDFNFTKKNTLVVIGGGILQDIGAFTAKIFKRGINWIFYPTTLLSQCDSCIGGKTGLNYKNNKNQLALFSAPSKVIIDSNFLKTLSSQDITSGMGEIVKIFLTGGNYYLENLDKWSMTEKVKNALAIKKAVIEYDEFEKMERKSLNLGHSFGHVIEPLTNYKIPHGEAVLLGIELINRLFEKNESISNLIAKYTNFEKIKHLDPKKLTQGLLSDKKVAGKSISFVRVRKPGDIFFSETEVNSNLEKKVCEILAH